MINRIVENFLNDLTDFSNVATSRQHLTSVDFKPDKELAEEDLDLNNHGKLLEQFRNLREKVSAEQRRYNECKREAGKMEKRYQQRLGQLEIKEMESQASLKYLKKEIEGINHGIDRLKSRNTELQKQLVAKTDEVSQCRKLPNVIQQLRSQNQAIQVQKQKVTEFLILQKLTLEDRMKQLQTVSGVDSRYFGELQQQIILVKARNADLQVNLKKLQGQSQVMRTLQHQQKADILSRNQQLERDNANLLLQNQNLAKLHEQDKASRRKNQNLSHKKEQLATLCQIQNQAQSRELGHLKRRVQRLTDKYEIKSVQAECEAFKSMEIFAKLHKSIEIAGQLIHRLKKEPTLPQDIERLMKICDYKMNKIKESESRVGTRRTPSKGNLSQSKRARSKSPLDSGSRKNLDLPEPLSYTTPKLKQNTDLMETACIQKQRQLERRLRKEMEEKESQIRGQIQFKKHSKLALVSPR